MRLGMSRKQGKLTSGVEGRAEWFLARLYSGEMTDVDESALQEWLVEDPRHRQAYERLLHVWDLSGDLANDQDIAASIRSTLRPKAGTGFDRRWLGLAVASLFFVIVTGALVGAQLFTNDEAQILETAVGDRQTYLLEDGSSVTLNTGSRILVDFDSTERRILLDFGEIYLEVAKDTSRALTITAGVHAITVLGTKFSVHLSGDQLEIAVVEGRVAVGDDSIRFPRATQSTARFKSESLILDAGAVARLSKDQETVENNLGEVERLQSWQSGQVRFENQSLMSVISEVNRYSKVKILIEDSMIADLRISAVLNLDQVEVTDQVELFLSSLEDIHPIRVVRHPDRFVLVATSPHFL